MKILSLFDGMACGMIAMLNAGVDVESYDAYEVDKYAIKTAMHNFPMIKEHGDVFEADFTQYDGVDFLIGGSPCTYWSIAQTKNRETVASGIGWELFSQYVRALHEAKPKYFIYENNKSMSEQIRKSINNAFGFESVLINSGLVSAQNRQRLYWVGSRNKDGTYSKVDIEQPEDRGILLKDVLDDAMAIRDKAHAVIASAGRTTEREFFIKNQGNMVAEPIGVSKNGKAHVLTTTYWNAVPHDTLEKHRRSLVAEYVQVGAMPRPNGELSTSQGFRIYSADAKSVGLKGNAGGAGGKTGLYAIKTDGKEAPVYEVKDGQITIKEKRYSIKLKDGYYIIRKLTVSECKRLQTVPEWYEFPVSNSQAYKMLGNGWTCEVITHLIKSCLISGDAK